MDNLKSFDVAKDSTATTETVTDTGNYDTTSQVPWTTVWPGAVTFTNAETNGAPNSTNTGTPPRISGSL